MLTGLPGIGKSTLAYNLLNFGFQLVADDVVILLRRAEKIFGFAPRKTRGLIMLDKLVDVSKNSMHPKLCSLSSIRFICHLTEINQSLHSSLETPTIVYQQVMGLSLPEVIMPVRKSNNIHQTIGSFKVIFDQIKYGSGNNFTIPSH